MLNYYMMVYFSMSCCKLYSKCKEWCVTILKHEVLNQHVDIETKSSYGIYVDLLESIIMIFTSVSWVVFLDYPFVFM
jgi:hypothetical protein